MNGWDRDLIGHRPECKWGEWPDAMRDYEGDQCICKDLDDMDKREAKRLAWLAALNLLDGLPMPVSSCGPDRAPESESSSANFARWSTAWEEVKQEMAKKAGLKA